MDPTISENLFSEYSHGYFTNYEVITLIRVIRVITRIRVIKMQNCTLRIGLKKDENNHVYKTRD